MSVREQTDQSGAPAQRDSASAIRALRSAAGRAALGDALVFAAASGPGAGDPLAVAAALRSAGYDPALAAAAHTQATLRLAATGKFGDDAASMFFTRTGLEQATRSVVSIRRAERLAAAGARSVADLGCGIGADAIAFARSGLKVLAVERDADTAAVTRANVEALGLADLVEVLTADATAVPLAGFDAVYCDPARRSATGRRLFDPARYSPPWDFVAALGERVPRTVLKLAPGIDHALIRPGWEAEWVSVRGEVVEAACWCGPLARVPRRATVIASDGTTSELTGSGTALGEVAEPRRYLFDPDGAVIRAHLVAELAAALGGTLADPTIAYIYRDEPTPTPFARGYEIIERLPIALKRLRAALRVLGVGKVTILKRGSALDVERLRRELRLVGDLTATIVLTRIADAPAALLCRPLPPAAASRAE